MAIKSAKGQIGITLAFCFFREETAPAMRFGLFVLAYALLMALILAAGFLLVVPLAGHSGTLSGIDAGLVWTAYGFAVLLGPWPVVRWLHRRFAVGRKADE